MWPEAVEDLRPQDYELLRRLVYEKTGINLGEQKQHLVRARLGKRLRAGGFKSYRAYCQHVQNDASGEELCALIDAISTNTTHLFRERQHFEFAARAVREWVTDSRWRRQHDALRIWSAGCSSGEEPYSIAMAVDDALSVCPPFDWKILATDVSTRMLARARAGVYDAHRLGTVPESFRRRYFCAAPDGDRSCVQIRPELRRRITFGRLNLITDRFPFRHRFQFIFCRNVMIYFDRPTQQRLVERFTQHLEPGGYLIIGHSESLNSIKHSLSYVQPTIYQHKEVKR